MFQIIKCEAISKAILPESAWRLGNIIIVANAWVHGGDVLGVGKQARQRFFNLVCFESLQKKGPSRFVLRNSHDQSGWAVKGCVDFVNAECNKIKSIMLMAMQSISCNRAL